MVEKKTPTTTITPSALSTTPGTTTSLGENVNVASTKGVSGGNIENVVNLSIDNKAIDQTVESLKNISKGELPSNEQILGGVEQAKEIVGKTSNYVSTETSQEIQQHAINLLDIIKQLVEEKNKDQVLQQFVYNTNQFIRKYSDRIADMVKEQKDKISTDQNDIVEQLVPDSQTLYESVQNFNNFIFELFRSNAFRLLMVDTLNYIRVMSRENIQYIDRKTNEGLKDAIHRLVSTFDDDDTDESSKKEIEKELESVESGSSSSSIKKKDEIAPKVKSDWGKSMESKSDKKMKTSNVKEEDVKDVKDDEEMKSVSEKQQEEKREKIEDQLSNRFHELIKQFSQNPSYKRAILGFFSIFDQLKNIIGDTVQDISQQLKEPESKKPKSTSWLFSSSTTTSSSSTSNDANQLFKEMRNDEYFSNILQYGKQLLIQWCGNNEKLINSMKQSLSDIYRAFSTDKELNKLLRETEQDIRRYLNDPTLLEKQENTNHVKYNLRRIREKIIEKKDVRALDRFNSQFNRAIQIMKRDETLQNLNEESRLLIRNLFLDEKGNFQLKSQTLNELKVMLVAMIKEGVESLTDLDIHYIDSDIEYKLSGLHIRAADILPSHIAMSGHSTTNIDYSEENLAQSLQGTQSTLVLHLSGMVCHFKNVQFKFKRFTFPQLSDEGLLDIDTGDDGLTIHAKIAIDTTSNSSSSNSLMDTSSDLSVMKENSMTSIGDREWFRSESINVEIDDLKLKFTHAEHHEILLRFLSGFIQNNMRRKLKDQIQVILQDTQTDVMMRLNHLIEQSMNAMSSSGTGSSGNQAGVSSSYMEGVGDSVSRLVSNQLSGYEEL